jgi:Flp pilus assembly protein TadD
MLRHTKSIALAALALGSIAFAGAQETQSACQRANQDPSLWVQCAIEAEPGSTESLLAHSHLGAQAFFNQDFKSASRYFDMSTPADGGEFALDTFEHALRASTYWRVGEDAKAKNHAQFAYNWIVKNQIGPSKKIEFTDDLLEPALEVLVPVMTFLEMEPAIDATTRYQSLPLESLTKAARRASVLGSVGAFDAALLYSTKAVTGQPENPVYLNDHCNLLTRMDLAETAISFCEAALDISPDNAEMRFTYALTLADLKKCDEAWNEQNRAIDLAPNVALFKEIIPCESEE